MTIINVRYERLVGGGSEALWGCALLKIGKMRFGSLPCPAHGGGRGGGARGGGRGFGTRTSWSQKSDRLSATWLGWGLGEKYIYLLMTFSGIIILKLFGTTVAVL